MRLTVDLRYRHRKRLRRAGREVALRVMAFLRPVQQKRREAAISGRRRMNFAKLPAIGLVLAPVLAPVLALVLALACAGLAAAQQGQLPGIKSASAACMASARDILTMKHADATYTNAVQNIVQQTKDVLVQTNLNEQNDLEEVAVLVAKTFAGKEKEIGDGMAQIYCNEFSDQDLKDLVAFYQSPLGRKLLTNEPRAIQLSENYMNQWAQTFAETVNAQFHDEMRKRGKPLH
jgi:uncharacterized protein